jgi:preprotein translocase subunit YajC
MKRKKALHLGLILSLIVALVFIVSCVPAGEPSGEGSSGGGLGNYTMIIFLVLIFAMLYFVMIRPQRKRTKEKQEMMAKLKSGDKVMTTAGIYGQIESISEDSVVLKIESGATIRVAKSSVVVRRQN